jgi:hypothetical protein
MPESKITIDAHIYGRADITKLLSSSNKERGFTLSNADILDFNSMMEWFEPDRRELDKLINVLSARNTKVFQIIADIANGEFGMDRRLRQGADFFANHYINSADVNNFFLNLEQVVRKHGVQKTISIDKIGIPLQERIKFGLDTILSKSKEEEKGGK